MAFKVIEKSLRLTLTILLITSCTGKHNQATLQRELDSLPINRGEITLCGSGSDKFGKVNFESSCSEKVKADFNLATALLHSFEYAEAEKVFAKVADEDPECIMAYWGLAMCNFHPLWSPPGSVELKKGSEIIKVARSIVTDKSSRESDYLEAIACIYDHWDSLDHHTRLVKFEKASEHIYIKYPNDTEAGIFYALSLDASADPKDKSFVNQKKAGMILNAILLKEPDHPGITHYIIHNYDYPELAELALPAARKYASIAAASAHAQHMPSHIFTRLGLWDESIQSNKNSIAAAQCYAEQSGIKGHWDEELHGMDYLMYAYLQKAEDDKALEQLKYLATIKQVSPQNFKGAYSFIALPARYAVERKDWDAASRLKYEPADLPWDKFLWEKANVNFSRALGNVHLHNLGAARTDVQALKDIQATLMSTNENYKASLVQIQVKASEGWIKLMEGKTKDAIAMMKEAADMEDATAKHPVTPGEIIPARELLGDMYLELNDNANAIQAFEEDLKKHNNRLNGLIGIALAEVRSGKLEAANKHYQQIDMLTSSSKNNRHEVTLIKSLLK